MANVDCKILMGNEVDELDENADCKMFGCKIQGGLVRLRLAPP